MTVLLGYEVSSGDRVEIPLAHTFVTGQTQLSGKTTTLRAIVERSGQRALAFVTKRGESFEGRRIRPYLPREGERPIHWRLVETILASALGERKLKYERVWLIHASRGAMSLADVKRNVERLGEKTKDARSKDAYMLIGEYLELVLPEMRSLAASDTLDLQPGLNVMDLAGVGLQLQALIIRAALEHINAHERGVLTVFPEAWEFAPRSRTAPAKDEAIAMARKGAVLGNFLLCDSQDIAGVDTVVRQAASVWILGVQRELNELKRTIQMIPAGIKRPKPEDVATLELGQFYACWGRHAVKTYVQPAWMLPGEACGIALGLTIDHVKKPEATTMQLERRLEDLERENTTLRTENADLRRRLEALERKDDHERDSDRRERQSRSGAAVDTQPRAAAGGDVRSGASARGAKSAAGPAVDALQFVGSFADDEEARYQRYKARLIAELPDEPALVRVVVARPELQVLMKRHTIDVDGDTLRGRIAQLIVDEFFSKSRTSAEVLAALQQRGVSPSNIELGNELKALTQMGFFTRDNKWISLVAGMKVHVLETV